MNGRPPGRRVVISRARLGAITSALLLLVPAPARTGTLGNKFELAATATVDGDAYFHSGDPDRLLLGRIELDGLWAPVPWGEVSGNIDLAIDSDSWIARRLDPDWREQSSKPRSAEVPELTASAHFSAADVTLGKLTARWGIGDILQPTDSITPRDLTDPLRDRRLGALGMLAELYPGDCDFSIAVVRHTPHRLPAIDSRWFPSGDLGGVELGPDLPSGSKGAVVAARLHGSTHEIDWTLTLRRGPDLAPHAAAGTRSPLFVYPGMTLAGGSISTAHGRFVLSAEAAVRRYDRKKGSVKEEDFATLLVGVEHRYPQLVFGSDATLSVELVRDQHLKGPDVPRQMAILDPVRLFETGLSARLLTHNPTGWEAEAGLAGDLSDGGGILRLLLRRNLGDRVDIELGADILTAEANAALAPVATNDRATLRVVMHQ